MASPGPDYSFGAAGKTTGVASNIAANARGAVGTVAEGAKNVIDQGKADHGTRPFEQVLEYVRR